METGKGISDPVVILKELETDVRRFCRNGLHGFLTLKFEAGRMYLLEKHETERKQQAA